MSMLNLNDDCLLKIFEFCEDKTLLNLCRTHQRLCNIIEDFIFSKKTRDLLLVGHRDVPIAIELRTHDPLSHSDRIRIGSNWLQGRYEESQCLAKKKLFPTKLYLEHDALYMTHYCYLRKYCRYKNQLPQYDQYRMEISTKEKSDIGAFVKKKDSIFAGRINGACFIHENTDVGNSNNDFGCTIEQRLHSTKEYLLCVDFHNDIYVTSSDKCCKLWQREEEFGLIHLEKLRILTHSFKAMCFSDDGYRLYGGLYTDINRSALRELDIESGREQVCGSNTLSIYDLKLKDENILFTANFDSTLRMYDRRLNRDIAIWDDPCDSSFYCLEYDGLYGLLCGAKYHSRVSLYDIRMPRKLIQMYFSRANRKYNGSPVYSIACDSRYLFLATDFSVQVLDFKADWAESKDYSKILINRI